MISSDK